MLYKFKTKAEVPDQLLYPMFYHPNDIAMDAVKDFWEYLEANPNIHDFFSETRSGESGGKMLGVLVVQDTNGELFYLRGYSGKLGGKTNLEGFVPLIYDYESDNSFFLPKTKDIVEVTNQIKDLESEFIFPLTEELKYTSSYLNTQLAELKAEQRVSKAKRKEQRTNASEDQIIELNNQSARERQELKALKRQIETSLNDLRTRFDIHNKEYEVLKSKRKQLSIELQNQLFKKVLIKNILSEELSVYDLFKGTPPSAAGECAAPKLFDYAIKNNLKPIALAEFWWGANNKSEIRKHKHFYPACKSKCSHILPFLLKGLNVQENPLLEQRDFNIEILFEDEHLIAINKPEGLLSVRGNTDLYSVQQWLEENRDIKGPGLVHRLDMATSGVLLAGKTKYVHELLQRQFLKKTVKKTYTSILDGILVPEKGIIDLPLRSDINDRPRQMVCYDHGKKAKTEYKVLRRSDNKTLIQFSPITGRTHQLRVHSAHSEGLNLSILGDKLYGRPSDRMYLHASEILFTHPVTRNELKIQSNINWIL